MRAPYTTEARTFFIVHEVLLIFGFEPNHSLCAYGGQSGNLARTTGKQIPHLAHPEHERRADDYRYPVLEAEAAHVEEVLQEWYFYHRHLSNENDCHDEQEPLATAEMERALACLERASVEEVEEVSHDEGGEEQRQLASGESVGRADVEVEEKVAHGCIVAVLEHEEHGHEEEEEEESYSEDVATHGGCEDGCSAVARLVVHNAARGWQRCEGDGCEGIHDEVYP